MVDINKMRRGYQREQRSGEYLQLQPGETLLYIHPCCRPDDKFEPTEGVNYIPVVVHYGIGKGVGGGGKGGKGAENGRMVASLDPEINPILEHPFIKRYLKAKKIKITGECPVSKLLQSGDLEDSELDNMRASTRYVWGVTPIAHRSSSSDTWNNMMPKPSVLMVGKQTFDGIMEVFMDNGDITDPNAAMLVIIKREGAKMSTKYTVRADPESLKKPKKLAKEVRASIAKATKEDGDCDLFKVVANMIKSPAEVNALISGVKMEDADFDEDEDDSEDDGESELYDAKSKKTAAVEDEDEDEEDEEEKPKAAAKGKDSKSAKSKPKDASKAVVEDEEDEEEADESEDEEDDDASDSDDVDSEPDVDDDDEDSEDDDDDDDDELRAAKEAAEKAAAALAAKAKAKADAKAKAKADAKAESKPKSDKPGKDKPDAEDVDLGLSEIDAELERIASATKPKDDGKTKTKKANGATARA